MSDPARKPISFDEAMAEEEGSVPAAAVPAAPEAPPSAPAQTRTISFDEAQAQEPPPPAPPPKRSIYERFKDMIPDELSPENIKHAPGFLGETAADTLQGVSRGLRMGFAQPISQKMADLGLDRTEEQTRADWDQASQRSPVANAVGDIAGSIANPVSRLSKIPKAGAAIAGAASGALRATGEGGDALSSGLLGGAFGVASQALPAAARWAGNRMSEGADKIADTLRLRSFGGRLGDLKPLSGDKRAELARAGEALGIHRGKGILPATMEEVEANATGLAERSGKAKDQIAAQIADVPVSNPALADRVRALKEGHGRGPGGTPLRAALDETADGFEAMPRAAMEGAQGPVQPTTPFGQMNLERQDYGKATNFTPGTPRAALRPKVYGAINDEMEQAANSANPGAGSAWRDANKLESYGIKFGDWSGRENTRADVNRLISPSDYAAGGVGAMLTGGGAVRKGYEEEGIPGAVKGMASAIPGALAGVALNRTVRGREHALAANFMRGAAQAGTAGESLAKFGQGAMGLSAGAVGQQVPTTRPPPSPTDNIQAALQTDPAALGSWGPRFADAKGDSSRLAALYHEAMQDPQFASQIAPRLRGAK